MIEKVYGFLVNASKPSESFDQYQLALIIIRIISFLLNHHLHLLIIFQVFQVWKAWNYWYDVTLGMKAEIAPTYKS